MSDTVNLTQNEYQDLIDSRDHAIAMRDVANGYMPLLTEAETMAFAEARSPLTFWRQRAGKTQSALAEAVGISQAYLAQIETNNRVGDVTLYVKLAKVLGVRVEDLLN
jgi:DNA-binding XRE family transcriptional regulator